ncbi:MAG: enolase C-terminal domain-like protein [Geminicoccaceae bacterium]
MRRHPRITRIEPTTVRVPLTSALRHANGCHWGCFVRTLIEVHTDEGLVGLGEMGGGGESAEATFRSLGAYLEGHDVFDVEGLRWKIANPTASLYNNRTQMLAAIEFACLDLMGKALDQPLWALLGGKRRTHVPFASYLFFTYPTEGGSGAEVRTPDQLVAEAKRLSAECGFTSHKLKGGVFSPTYELEAYRALCTSLPGQRFRHDPNAAWSVHDSIRFARAIADLDNDFLEDPCFGLNGMRQVKEATRIPLATNTVVVNFEQLATNLRDPAVDVILLDTTFWGGVRPCLKAAGVCETFQQEVCVHSSGELGIQLATMLHFGAVLPALPYAIDAHYHHLADDVIMGGKLPYSGGAMPVPDGPGLGVALDPDRVARYAEAFKRHGGYRYDRDPARPDWYGLSPNENWADPKLHYVLPAPK